MYAVLGVDMSVDTIIGIPFIKELVLELTIIEPLLIAHHIRTTFPVIYKETVLTQIPVDKEKVHDVDKEEEAETTRDDPPRLSFKLEARLVSAPLSPLFQAVAQDSGNALSHP